MAELRSHTRLRRAVVASCLISLLAAAVMAQSTSPPSPGDRVVVVTGQGEPLVSVRPGEIGCRALLAEIVRQANVQVRNLALVPDDVVYVQLDEASVPDAISRVLRFAKVDYVLRGGSPGSGPWLLLVADRPTVAGSLRATDGASHAPTQLRSPSREAARSPFGPAPELAAEPTQAPVLEPAPDGDPSTGQMPTLPEWHPGEPLPSPATIPPEPRPGPFEFEMRTAPWPMAPSPSAPGSGTLSAPPTPGPAPAPPGSGPATPRGA